MSDNYIYFVLTSLILIGSGGAQAADDPTRPGRSYQGSALRQENATSVYQVSAIFINDIRPQAIVNGHLVSKGDKLADAVVKRITKDSVVLAQLRDGTWQSISLFVNKPSSNKLSIRAADKY